MEQIRPDISFAACNLSTLVKKAAINDVQTLNKQIRKLKEGLEQKKLFIPDIGDVTESTVVVYSDASHANLHDGGSQGGFIIFLQGVNDKSTPIGWKSHRLKRVVKSAMAAETMSFIEAVEHALFYKAILQEIYNCDKSKFPIICVSDNKSLIESAASTKVLEDKRLQIDICSIREMLQNQEIKSINWVPSQDQLADCMTKATASSGKLMEVIVGNEVLPAM